jgi:predicted O-linked N-acetylglucosamine transferase (SPINDLY family)
MSKPKTPTNQVKQDLLRLVETFKSGHTQKAHTLGIKFLAKHGPNFDVLHLLGTIELAVGQINEAWSHWQNALSLKSDHLLLLNKMGSLARKLGKENEAESFFQRAIASDPSKPEAHFNLGNCFSVRENWLPAIQSYTNAIECNPDYSKAYYRLAMVLENLGRPDEALKVLTTGLRRTPDNPYLHLGQARALKAMSLNKVAITCLRESLHKLGNHFEILSELADLEAAENEFTYASQHYLYALELKPDSYIVHNNYANMLRTIGKLDEAMNHYKKAIKINPNFYQALQNLCNIFNARKDFSTTLQYLEQVRKINPTSPYLIGMFINARLHTCNWDDWIALTHEVELSVARGEKAVSPFPPLAFFTDANLLTRSASLWVTNGPSHSKVLPAINRRQRSAGQKIRVGYYSADLYTHATALLMVGVFESHDRDRFEWFAFNFGRLQEDALSIRVRKSFDQFLDVRSYSDRVVAQLSREIGIDIAIDLKGFTENSRPGIFAARAAPIQVNYLGFPGSMGAPYIDYIIADPVIIPNNLKQHYSESVVRLPYCYQTNDNQRPITPEVPSRHSQGLPVRGRVLCSFNNNYKITPQVFDIWMRILKLFSDCVLWLLEDNPHAVENLQLEAERRGVEPTRLIFAPRLRNEDHLARHRLADLFLDTFPCNAHTTASDALWAGLPMITCCGETFASRVAASLLTTMDMPDCITEDLVSYEEKIVALLEDPGSLRVLHERVEQGRKQSPLFDTKATAVYLESAYCQMMQRYEKDLLPEDFDVAP